MSEAATQPLDRTRAPEISDVPSLSLPAMAESRLANGARLLELSRHTMPVALLTVVREGGFTEMGGLADGRLYSQMLHEGTAAYSSADIASAFEINGVMFNTMATAHHLVMKVWGLSSRLPELMPVVRDMFASPQFPEASLSALREMGAMNIDIMRKKVSFMAAEASKLDAYGSANPLAHVPTADRFRSVTSDDLRGVFARFGDSPMTVYLAGDITETLRRAVTDTLGTLPVGAPSPIVLNPPHPENMGQTRLIAVPDALQSGVSMTLPAIPRTHPDYNLLQVTVKALGGYFGSRLMTAVREEKGFTYGISSYLVGQPDGGIITVDAECDNRFVEPLIAEVRSEMRRLAAEPPSGEELSRLRQATASDLLQVLETPFQTVNHYVAMQTTGMPAGNFEARLLLLRDLTPAMIADAARRYLDPDRLAITVAGA